VMNLVADEFQDIVAGEHEFCAASKGAASVMYFGRAQA
jgi:hypothetical protein